MEYSHEILCEIFHTYSEMSPEMGTFYLQNLGFADIPGISPVENLKLAIAESEVVI